MMNSAWSRAVLAMKCPVCHRGNGHWCRDEKGKCIQPHRQRATAAIEYIMGPLSLRPRPGGES
jgi:hypothetical protein